MTGWLLRALRRARYMTPPDGEAAGTSPPAAEAAPAAPAPAAAAPAAGTSLLAAVDNAPAAAGTSPDSTASAEPAKVEPTPSLLSSAAAKPAETPAPSTAKPAEAPPAEPPSPAPAPDAPPQEPPAPAPAPLSIEDLVLPDGARADAEEARAFVECLNNAELSPKERAQGLLGLYEKEMGRIYREANERQQKFWENLNAGWREELRQDREIGGNRLETSLSKAKGMIIEYARSPAEADLLLRHCDANGMGNYPPFIAMLVKLADKLNIFEDSYVAAPAAPSVPRRAPGSRGWYDNSIDKAG